MNNTSTLLLIAVLISGWGCLAQICQQSQKGFYMSYNAMSKRDTLPDLFIAIDAKIPLYNASYRNTSTGTTYVVTNMHPQMYYNEHHQKETYIDQHDVNVSLGDIDLAFRLNFAIQKNAGNVTGSGHGRVHVEQTAYFTKRMIVKDGYIQWDPITISPLMVVYDMVFDSTDPKLEFEDKQALESLINDHVGDRKLKEEILKTFNTQYSGLLKEHLNNESVIGTTNITYSYAGIQFSYINAVKEYSLSNSDAKGLEAKFIFQLDGQTTNCSQSNITFNATSYGGLQEVYSIATLQNTFKYALSKGLYDVILDRSYEVDAFQFYMGDLSNFVPAAELYSATEPISVSCAWDKSEEPRLTGYADHDVFAVVSEICTVQYNNNTLMRVNFGLNLVVRISSNGDTLNFNIIDTTVFMPKWTIQDPKFTIGNSELATYYVAQVAKSVRGRKVLGTGWKVTSRRFPVVQVLSESVIIFDPSEL